MSSLRDEIIEAQKARSDLLKWKLIIVSALGAAGLGLSGEGNQNFPLLLLLIPLVCFYIDLLCSHLALRMIVVGTFFRRHSCDDEQKSYERFVHEVCRNEQKDIFNFEDWAMHYSTTMLSVLIMLVGLFVDDKFKLSFEEFGLPHSWQVFALFAVSGLFGIGMTWRVRHLREQRCHDL